MPIATSDNTSTLLQYYDFYGLPLPDLEKEARHCFVDSCKTPAELHMKAFNLTQRETAYYRDNKHWYSKPKQCYVKIIVAGETIINMACLYNELY